MLNFSFSFLVSILFFKVQQHHSSPTTLSITFQSSCAAQHGLSHPASIPGLHETFFAPFPDKTP
jgi:hypothetical protein